MRGGPWPFDNAMVVVEEYDGLRDHTFVAFLTIRVWVQLKNLPPALKSDMVGRIIGATLGSVFEVDRLNVLYMAFVVMVRIKLDLESKEVQAHANNGCWSSLLLRENGGNLFSDFDPLTHPHPELLSSTHTWPGYDVDITGPEGLDVFCCGFYDGSSFELSPELLGFSLTNKFDAHLGCDIDITRLEGLDVFCGGFYDG